MLSERCMWFCEFSQRVENSQSFIKVLWFDPVEFLLRWSCMLLSNQWISGCSGVVIIWNQASSLHNNTNNCANIIVSMCQGGCCIGIHLQQLHCICFRTFWLFSSICVFQNINCGVNANNKHIHARFPNKVFSLATCSVFLFQELRKFPLSLTASRQLVLI